jgi:EmrB/QacA subfamily drug resistance transporter
VKFKLEYKWLALAVTNVGLFMACLDSSIVIIGLPTILDQLHASLFHGIWIITGYSLMMTILPVMLGRLADLYGRVRLFNLGFVIFTIGSLLCALSQNGQQLVLFRLLQGSGSALLIVNCIPIIVDAFPKEQLGLGLGTNVMAANLGNIAGYTLSGVMIGFFGWRSIFLLNVPVGIAGSIFGYFSLREISIKPVGEKFDYSGAILYCVGLLTILIGLTIGNPASVRNIIIMGGGIIIFAIAILVAFRQEHPTLDVKLFKIRAFAAGTMASFLNSIAFACGPFLRSLYLQLVLGYSPMKTGLLLIPMEILIFILSPISGRLSDRIGSRVLTCLGLAVNASALFWFSTLNQNSSYSAILVSLVLFGIGISLFASPNVSSIMGSVPPERRGIANGISMTLSQTGSVLSVPFSLLLMTLVMPYARLSQIVGSTQLISSTELPQFMAAINHACFILGIIVLCAIIPSALRGPQPKITGKNPTSQV